MVDEGDVAGAPERRVERRTVQFGVDPGDGEQAIDLVTQPADGLEAASSLRERDGLDEHMIVREEPLALPSQPGEDPPGLRVARILLAEERVQRRRIDEDRYEP